MEGIIQKLYLNRQSFISGANLDLDFRAKRYLLNGAIYGQNALFPYFTRASAALGQNLDGTYTEFATNEPRITQGLGLEIERAATNRVILNPQSNLISGGAGAEVIATGLPDVFGGTEAIRVRLTRGTTLIFRLGGSLPTGTVSASCFAKLVSNSGVTSLKMDVRDGTQSQNLLGDLVQDNYVRLQANALTPGAVTGFVLDLAAVGGDVGTELVLDLCGFQVEDGEIITSPTNGARSPDNFIIPANVSNFDLSEGYILMKWREKPYAFINDGVYPKLMRVSATSTTNHRFDINRATNSGAVTTVFRNNNVIIMNPSISKPDDDSVNTAMVTWGGGSGRAILNGAVFTDTSVTMPSEIADISIGCNQNGNEVMNTIVERVVIGHTKLADSEQDRIFAEVAA